MLQYKILYVYIYIYLWKCMVQYLADLVALIHYILH